MTDNYDEDVIFEYHSPAPHISARYRAIRKLAKMLALEMREHCPPSDELDQARARLEEAVMHANAAIAREPARRAKKEA